MGLTWVAQRFIATSAGHLARIYLVMHGNSYRSVQAAQRSADLLTTMITKLLSLWRNIAVEATEFPITLRIARERVARS